MEPLISVIVPVYNVEPYLHKCVDSILNQTYRNLEVILVDDGSPDGCPEICDEYAAQDNRVKVIHKENGGLSDARNAGMAVMNGEYIAFVDSDDYIERDHLSSLYSIVNGKHKHVIAASDIQRVDGNGKILQVFGQMGMEHIAMEPIFGYAWNKLYSAQLLRNIYFDDVRYVEDLLFNLRVLCRGPEYVYSRKSTYSYTLRENSILTSELSYVKIENFLGFNEKVWPYICDAYPDLDDREKIYAEVSSNHMCNFLCAIAISDRFSLREKNRLSRKILNSVFQRKVRWKYAPHNLLRLAIIAQKLYCPWIYTVVYQYISFLKGRADN